MTTEGIANDSERAMRLFTALAHCFSSVSERSRREIARCGLSSSEFGVLELLRREGPLPLGEIADRVLLTSGSITYVVDQLVQKEFVRRVACPKDRRRLYAELTDAGLARIRVLIPDHAEVLRDAVSGLAMEEQEELCILLERLDSSVRDPRSEVVRARSAK